LPQSAPLRVMKTFSPDIIIVVVVVGDGGVVDLLIC
jgi:hypothetical protein